MKKILDAFDYVFYRMHKFVLAHPSIQPDSAPHLFFIVFYMPSILIIAPICRALNVSPHRYSATWIILMVVLLVSGIPVYKRYQNNQNIQKFEERWGKEDSKQRKKRGWIVVAVIIFNVVLIPILGCVLAHYNII